jgi:hypothetical protein
VSVMSSKMNSITFVGVDKQDLDKQMLDWRAANSNFAIKKVHSPIHLPPRRYSRADEGANNKGRVLVRVDYESRI